MDARFVVFFKASLRDVNPIFLTDHSKAFLATGENKIPNIAQLRTEYMCKMRPLSAKCKVHKVQSAPSTNELAVLDQAALLMGQTGLLGS